jgi:transcriptional regulator with PAS, ATPase and Fis domain
MITYTTARELGMNAFLITSGIESIRAAFDTAILYCSSYSNIRNENHFLRQLILGRDARTVVFTKEGKLFYSTLSEEDTAVLDILHEKIDEVPASGKRRFLQRQNNLLYSIQSQRIISNELEYVAFYFTVSKPPLSGNKCGINYGNRKEVEKDYFSSIYIIMDSITELENTVDHINQNFSPVIILGERGTGKEQIAKAIYLRSSINDHPFVQIDCTLLTEKIWDYLLNNHNSPLCDAGNTIFIKNINALSEQQQSQLLIAIADMEICKRNRVIFSCISNSEGTPDSNAMEFINRLHCFIITLPSLRNDLSRLDSLVKLYLNRLNIDMAKQILGVSADAMQLLKNFSWPYNYVQFHRILRDLVIMSTGSYIRYEDVQEVLSKERTITTVSLHSTDASNTLDISRPLNEINKEVVDMVLEAHRGNQSKAAQSLGISRTTLWRIIKSQGVGSSQ